MPIELTKLKNKEIYFEKYFDYNQKKHNIVIFSNNKKIYDSINNINLENLSNKDIKELYKVAYERKELKSFPHIYPNYYAITKFKIIY